ncbi:MAG: diaminopimelate decarboxylase [Candidatus Eisenbacteria bacterium]|nr:diaminopimelate decarboxylase [Candidatus Eisenbacteria bacterium]
MSVTGDRQGVLALGGVPLDELLASLRRRDPAARAFWAYDLDAFTARAHRLLAALAPLGAHAAYALKANGLPALARTAAAAGLDADAGSLGELALAGHAGFGPGRRTLSGNGRTREEADWAATHGVAFVSADHVGELDLLEDAAARSGAKLRVALRVNPGIFTPGHRHVATGHLDAKFGVEPGEALEAWASRARWPNLRLDGLHLHVGSQLLETAPLEGAARFALELARQSESRGAPLAAVNLGGGFGVDYERGGDGFPLERHLGDLARALAGGGLEWRFEPGRWLVAPVGVLVAEVSWVKLRRGSAGEQRFVVLSAGMNDLLRPALYGARHRIVPVRPRPGAGSPAIVVGPVCESGDTFSADATLPPLERGDLVALLDAGAYGSAMSSNYNGRGRLAEIAVTGGRARLVRAAESPAELLARQTDLPLS